MSSFLYQLMLFGAAGLKREGVILTSVLQPDICKKILDQKSIPVMDCQALSPVMSPVKHVPNMLKQRIYWLENTHENLTEIHEALLEEWDNNPQKCSASNGEYVVNMS